MDAVRREATDLVAQLVALQSFSPGAEAALAVAARIHSIAVAVASLESRYPAMLTRWARGQRLELKAQAVRLLGAGQLVVTAPEWSTLP